MPDTKQRQGLDLPAQAKLLLKATNGGHGMSRGDALLARQVAESRHLPEDLEAFNAVFVGTMWAAYQTPFLFGIPNLYLQEDGTLIWRNFPIDCFPLAWAFTEAAREEAMVLARRCRFLESEGRRISHQSVIQDWGIMELQAVLNREGCALIATSKTGWRCLVRENDPILVFGRISTQWHAGDDHVVELVQDPEFCQGDRAALDTFFDAMSTPVMTRHPGFKRLHEADLRVMEHAERYFALRDL